MGRGDRKALAQAVSEKHAMNEAPAKVERGTRTGGGRGCNRDRLGRGRRKVVELLGGERVLVAGPHGGGAVEEREGLVCNNK